MKEYIYRVGCQVTQVVFGELLQGGDQAVRFILFLSKVVCLEFIITR